MGKNAAITHLQNLAISGRATSLDEDNIRQQDYNDITSRGLTQCIIDFVRFTGGQAIQIQGTSKISAIINGRNGEIDVKISENKQIESNQITEQSYGFYFQAVDFLSFYYWYNDAFNGKGAEDGI